MGDSIKTEDGVMGECRQFIRGDKPILYGGIADYNAKCMPFFTQLVSNGGGANRRNTAGDNQEDMG